MTLSKRRRTRSPRTRAAGLAVAASVVASLAAGVWMPGAAQATSRPDQAAAAGPSNPSGATANTTANTTTSLPVVTVHPIPAGDEVVTGRGDQDGWHLYAATSAAPNSWQPLATLAPTLADPNGESWIGRQCLTGDGNYVVAVVAPWSANNSPAGMDRGGIAYVVDAHSGAVRPLVTGVSLHYFNPACGAGSTVALTRYVGTDEQTTQLIEADAATASVRGVQTRSGELTAAVPAAGGGILAVRDHSIVKIAGGAEKKLADLPGQPFDLVADAAGGADFLLGSGSSATVWTTGATGRARQIGTGSFQQLALFNGRGGHASVAGADQLDAGNGVRALPMTSQEPEAVSLDGTLTASAQSAAPNTAAPATHALPGVLTDSGTIVGPPRPAPTHATASTASSAASSSPPYTSLCAVGRNDPYLQAMQPSPEQVAWAANMAGRGQLQGQYARPANYANLNLPTGYSPSLDFPLPAPFGAGGAGIPREVLEAVYAQESNFRQATWHSMQGIPGNPLTADYYAAGGGYVVGAVTDSTGAPNPDCGYGLGQVTTGMRTGQTAYDLQRKVAVDYAENAAASAQILAQKWNELAAAGIVAGDGSPATLESWFFAVWDYNSGLHAESGSGPWGLGWANNPANPAYPYNRHPFLHQDVAGVPTQTYGDAATPGDWPYEEKIMGWMERPLENPLDGDASYTGTMWSYDPILNSDQLNANWYELARPGIDDFCDPGKNQCDPSICDKATYGGNCNPSATQGTGPCTRTDFECWWHYPSDWCSLTNVCHGGSWEYSLGSAEPPAAASSTPAPVCSVSASDIPTGTYLVDSQPSDANLRGCTSANRNWNSSGSFAFSYGDPQVPGSQQTDMDVHQLGAGLGGHIYFTHTNEPTDAAGTSYWGVTGTWSPTLPKGRYQVRVFVPDLGATATEADYTISNGLGYKRTVTINQNASNGWVPLATTWLGPGASVSLTNLHVGSGGDLAFSGMAFVPVAAGQYAMIGDSYSSGEGTGNGTYDSDTDNYQPTSGCPPSNEYCVNNGHRSKYSYNRVFAAGTTTFSPPSSRVDVACSGALIGDYTANNPTGQCPNEVKQQSAVNSSTSLITLTFGGNDLDFQPIIEGCVKAGITNIITGSLNTCQSQFGTQLSNDIAALTNAQDNGKLDLLYQQIRADAPNADVTVLGYPHLFVGTAFNSVGRCLADGWITNSDQDWLNASADAIDQAISTAAARAGFDYMSTSALFNGHELCTSAPYLTGILDPTTNDNAVGVEKYLSLTSSTVKQQFFHPNISGYQNEATLLAAGLQVP